MKKLLSILMAVLMLVSVVGSVPTVFAEEVNYILVNESEGKFFWEEFTWKNDFQTALGVVKVGDWYYNYTKNKETQNIVVSVCGYEGNETEITIPCELAGISIYRLNEFYLFSTTVKTIKIPKEITSINDDIPGEFIDSSMEEGHPYDYCPPIIECVDGQFEEIIVDDENKYFSSLDGVLFTKNRVRLLYYPHYKADEKYIVPDSVQYISGGAFAGAKKLKSLTITPNVQELGYNSIPKKGLEELRYENAHLPDYKLLYVEGEEDEDHSSPMYLPDVPDTVVYCVKNSALYKEYKKSFEEPEAMCKELKTLTLDDTPTLKKGEDGKWYYYEGNYRIKATTLVKYKGKWFYVYRGVWDKNISNVMCAYKNKSFYITKGKWDKTANGLILVDYDYLVRPWWTYVVNGKKYDVPKDLIKYKGKWFYVVDGYWNGNFTYSEWDEDSSINTLFNKNGKWFAIIKGKWYKGKAIIKYKNKKFYVNKGFVQFKYSGKVKVDGKTYKIKNGKVA